VVSHLLNMGRVALNMRRLFGLPYIVILHGMDVALAASGGWRKRSAARAILSQATQVICNSNYTANWAKSLGLSAAKISIVNPPPSLAIDTSIEQRQVQEFRQRHKIGDDFLLLSAGRLVTRKGFDICLEAVAALFQEGRNISYVIIGAGPDKDKLEQQAIRLGIFDRVRFLGAVSAIELATAYAACDTFVMIPRSLGGDIEGFGIVYLEANIFGKPTVGSRSGGVPESVLHEETGLLVESDNVTELKNTLKRLIDDTKLRERLGRGGQRRLQRDFGDDRQARCFQATVRRAAMKR
ncbi:glycosyltransferase family 4 protein, partial [Patescibacteria group bacterium]|nr:glycosyltransferase family 4 protein [Patescibacteria group bacterium]